MRSTNLNHSIFIETSLFNILEESVSAFQCSTSGMEAHAISEYFLESTFLRLTGALEQKLKCIVWDMATIDYKYRYKMLQNSFGECSSYDEKKRVYNDLIKEIKHFRGENLIEKYINTDKKEFITEIKEKLTRLFEESTLKDLMPRKFKDF